MQGRTSVPLGRPVRQVTLVNASWSEQDRGVRGAFDLTFRDEDGEYVLRAAPEDADTLLGFLASSREVLLELGHRVAGIGNWVPSGRPGPSGAWAEASLMQT